MSTDHKQRPGAGLHPHDAGAASDEELALAARCGSLSQFEELVYRYEKPIFSFVLTQCGNSADAQELTQDTFVKAWHAITSWKADMPFKPWLFTIARRKCIDHHRLEARRVPPSELSTEADHASPADTIVRREEGDALWDLAHRVLPDPQFQCLWLRYVEDMDISDISKVTGKSLTHVKVLLFRSRMTLARHVSREPKIRPSALKTIEPGPKPVGTTI